MLGTPGEDCRARPRPPPSRPWRASSGRSARSSAGASPPSSSWSPSTRSPIWTSTLRFLLSARSAYVSGQVIRISPAGDPRPGRLGPPAGRQGGPGHRGGPRHRSRHRGVLTRDGAQVVGIDLPRWTSPPADGRRAPIRPTGCQGARWGRHRRPQRRHHPRPDAGPDDPGASGTPCSTSTSPRPQRINALLLDERCSGAEGRIIGVSSIAGIAGNRGQTNYATSKAGVIGMVRVAGPRPAEVEHHRQRGRARVHRDRR